VRERALVIDGLRGRAVAPQVMRHLMSKNGDGGEEFHGVRVMCYDSAGWVRKNFRAKVDAHNEASLLSHRGDQIVGQSQDRDVRRFKMHICSCLDPYGRCSFSVCQGFQGGGWLCFVFLCRE